MLALAYSSAVLAVVAAACGTVAAIRDARRGRSVGVTLVALALAFVAAIAVLGAALCGAN
jgi:hypothetical protein